MGQSITLERVGRRVYLAGLTYEQSIRARDEIGATWDGDRRQRWVGAAKLAAAEALVAALSAPVMAATPAADRAAKEVGLDAGTPAGVVADKLEEAGRPDAAAAVRRSETAEQIDRMRVHAAVEHKGRRYYVVAEQRDPQTREPVRCRLTTLDGAAPFWADCAACALVRTYEGRQKWDGRQRSGRTVTVYPTIGSLRRFRDRQQNPATARVQCVECGSWHDAAEACRDCGGC